MVTKHTPLEWEDGAGAYLRSIAEAISGEDFQVQILWLKPHEHIKWAGFWRPAQLKRHQAALKIKDAWSVAGGYLFPLVFYLPFKARCLHRLKQIMQFFGFSIKRRTRKDGQTTNKPSPPTRNCSWREVPSGEELSLVQRLVRLKQPDILISNFAWVSTIFDLPEANDLMKLIICHDVQYLRSAQLNDPVELRYTKDHEKEDLSRADALVTISDSDTLEIQEMLPDSKTITIPMISESPTNMPRSKIAGRCVFVGSHNEFNKEALSWLLHEIWPLVLSQNPKATLDICGSICASFNTHELPNVSYLGVVPDLSEIYAYAELALVPLLRGSGMKTKVVDACANRLAVVGTSVAFQGLPDVEKLCSPRDSAENFAARVIELLKNHDERAEVAGKSQAIVKQNHSPTEALITFTDLIDSLSRANRA